MLNAKELKALAREARKLASDICEGREPELQSGNWCNCGAGEVARRAGFSPATRGQVAFGIDFLLEPKWTITRATEEQVERGVEGALIFPLLWAADELENAARSAAPKGLLEEGEGK